VLEVVDGPLTDDTAGSRIQGWLPQPSAAPASAAP
jgi:hypothetical protein